MVVVNSFNVHPKLGELVSSLLPSPCLSAAGRRSRFRGLDLGRLVRTMPPQKGTGALGRSCFLVWVIWRFDCAEGLAQLLTGHADAAEIDGPIQQLVGDCWTNWYALLDAGFRIPLAGASMKASNEQLLGRSRTYAYLGPAAAFEYPAWVEAVRAGRSCVSDGPFIDLQVDGNLPGATIDVAGPGQRLHVKAAVQAAAAAAHSNWWATGTFSRKLVRTGRRARRSTPNFPRTACAGWQQDTAKPTVASLPTHHQFI